MNYPKNIKVFIDINERPDRERPRLPLSDIVGYELYFDEENPYIEVQFSEVEGKHLRCYYSKKEVLKALGYDLVNDPEGDLVRNSEKVFDFEGDYVDDREIEISIDEIELTDNKLLKFLMNQNILNPLNK